jgi:molecular chaperone GrpE
MNNEEEKDLEREEPEASDWEVKADEYKAGWQRANADLDNMRKRLDNMRGEIAEFVRADVAADFLSVYDDFKRAMAVDGITPELKMGLESVAKKFEKVLEANGLTQIAPKAGDEFNPDEHEAVSHEDSEIEEGYIIETFEAGLKIGDRVVRPAKVRVSKGAIHG